MLGVFHLMMRTLLGSLLPLLAVTGVALATDTVLPSAPPAAQSEAEAQGPAPLTPPPGMSIMPPPPMVPVRPDSPPPGCAVRNLKPLELLV